MKDLLSILILILFVGKLNAQNERVISLTGKVLTADKFPAVGVYVFIEGTRFSTFTDKFGYFKIKAPVGKSVLVSATSKTNSSLRLPISSLTDKDLATIYIKEKFLELNEVVVTGQYQPQTLKNAVYKVRIVDNEKIKAKAAINIQQLLNTEFGFRFSNDLTLGTSDVEMMGMSGRNVKILLDGVPLVDRSDLRESLNQVDVNTVERIEIIEGPMSVVYGTDALAGVINIITKKADSHKFNISVKIHEETAGKEYNAFTNKGIHNQNVTLSWRNKYWYALGGFSNNTFGGWNVLPKTATSQQVNQTTFFKPKDQYLANAKIGFTKGKLNFWYRLDWLTEDILSRGGINPNYTVVTQKYTTDRINNQIHADWNINSDLYINLTGGYTNLKRATKTTRYDYATGSESLTTGQAEQDLAGFYSTIFRATLQYKFSDKLSVQPGLEYNRDAGDGARISGSPVINDYAAFVSAEIKPIEILKVKPGIRFMKNSVYDAPKAIPSLNAMLQITNNLEFRLGYGRGFRAPALRELYFDFFDASHSIMGNKNLKAEKSNSFDASLSCDVLTKGNLKVRSTISGFYNDFSDRIEYGMSVDNPNVTTLINISKYKTTGFSFDNNFNISDFKFNVGASFIGRYNQLTENAVKNNVPTFSWTPEVFGNLNYNLPKIKTAINLFIKYTGSRPSYQIDNNNLNTASLVKIGDFTWSDLMLSKVINKYLSVNGGVKNLFDVTTLTNSAVSSGGAHGSASGSVAYSYGRSYTLGLALNWNK